MAYTRILLLPDSPLPVRTAAEELTAATGAEIAQSDMGNGPGRGEIALLAGARALAVPETAKLAAGRDTGGEWEVVAESGGGLVIGGSSARNVCRAALGWISDPELETGRFSAYRFAERFTMWDTTMNQWYRHGVGFDRKSHIRELARMGHSGVEVNRYADYGGWHVRNREFPKDSYAWYLSYCPALDAFVESSLTRGLYPAEELRRNMEDLREAAALARFYGMSPGFVCYEPRSVNDAIFRKYPQLRGSRTDHPGRSLQPRYALDIANPRVLEHYAESLTLLMNEVPDLRYFVFWTADSGSGLPFQIQLYFGPNGSYLARSKRLEQMAAEFSGTLLDAGRKINPRFEVMMEIGWEYRESEWRRIIPALPEGVNPSHPLTGSAAFILCGMDPEAGAASYLPLDRESGKEPFGEIVVSTWWDLEPVFGIAFPWVLAEKFESLGALGLKSFHNRGAVDTAPNCPYMINHDLFAELVRGHKPENLYDYLFRRALRWCEGDKRAAGLLVDAWQSGEKALRDWPVLNWYIAGPAATSGRWLTRPLVPDFSRLDKAELAAFEREVFTLEWDVARLNLAFEGGIRMYDEERFEQAVESYDRKMLPMLEMTVGTLEKAHSGKKLRVIEDQLDRYRGLLLLQRTLRNSMAAQAAINRWLLEPGRRAEQRDILDRAIASETANTRAWIELLTKSRTRFFRLSAVEETPFLYKTPVEDLSLRLEVMERHRDDTPGPDLPELHAASSVRSLWPHGEL